MKHLDGLHSFPEVQDCQLMGHHHKEMDVESLRKSGRRRGSCLDACLVLSIMFLFVAVTAGAAAGVMVVMELRSKLERPSVLEMSKLSGDVLDHTYKMQNFVYLEAASSELKTSTMHWAPVNFAAQISVGSNYLFDAEQHSLKAERPGTYFMYIGLNLTCTYQCNAGLLSVRVSDKLNCEVQLPEVADSTPVSRKCWTVSRLEGQKLLTQMTVPKEGLENWRLELSGSGFGMFLVD